MPNIIQDKQIKDILIKNWIFRFIPAKPALQSTTRIKYAPPWSNLSLTSICETGVSARLIRERYAIKKV